jgi:hypothetical protein
MLIFSSLAADMVEKMESGVVGPLVLATRYHPASNVRLL